MLRPLIINGFMATGKTTAARIVAERTGRPWVDLDHAIAAASGRTIDALFREQGEAHFRSLERTALEQALSRSDGPVISVGGGALLDRQVRLRAMRAGVLVCLTARSDTLRSRLAGDATERPLLRPGAEDIARLLELRAGAYAEAHEQLPVDALQPQDVAARLIDIWNRNPLGVAAGTDSYSVEVSDGGFQARLLALLGSSTGSLLISDSNVGPLYAAPALASLRAAGMKASTFFFEAGEEQKNPQTLATIWQQALEAGADRKSCFVGLGGGVVTDIAGFAAATWMRGVPWISAPTSLLAMVDAAVGGKTAVDLPAAKNCVGAFWQPKRVLCDVSHLRSEPERGFRSALAEVVKTALIGDADLLELLEREREAIRNRSIEFTALMVRRCIAVKADVVSADAREAGVRAALNLGHTFGHALEAHAGYGTLTHGEAVSLGLVAALRVGEQLGKGDAGLTRRVSALLDFFGLPTALGDYDLATAARLIASDKKRSGSTVRFVLTPEPGRFLFETLALEQLAELASSLAASSG